MIDFVGIGQPKCQSSWIQKCLNDHPDIFLPENKNYIEKDGSYLKKEIFFFNYNNFSEHSDKYNRYYKEGIDGYLKYFKNQKQNQIKGEISTSIMYNIKQQEILQKEFPNLKILAYLRNPIDRMISNYRFLRQMNQEQETTFETVIKNRRIQYIETSKYFKYIKLYFDLFPRKNIKILIYENIQKDQIKFIRSIYQFLNVNDTFISQFVNQYVNKTIYNKKINISQELKKELYEKEFKEDILKLEKLINEDLSIWKIN